MNDKPFSSSPKDSDICPKSWRASTLCARHTRHEICECSACCLQSSPCSAAKLDPRDRGHHTLNSTCGHHGRRGCPAPCGHHTLNFPCDPQRDFACLMWTITCFETVWKQVGVKWGPLGSIEKFDKTLIIDYQQNTTDAPALKPYPTCAPGIRILRTHPK